MRLDKIKFAKLVSFLSETFDVSFSEGSLEALDEMTDTGEQSNQVPAETINTLLFFMQAGERKIDAIKAYRALTGVGLKESKDAVERYSVQRDNILNADELKQQMLAALESSTPIIGDSAKADVQRFIGSFTSYRN